VSVEVSVGLLTILAVYLPLRYTLSKNNWKIFYNTLGCQFIAQGVYNAKHTDGGPRLVALKGLELLKTMESKSLKKLEKNPHTGHLTGMKY
jgi:hypothetical protein